jgi:hypothetical protein
MNPASTQPVLPAVPRSNNANTFTLQCRDISITYSATSITGQPLLHYKDRRHEVNAQGQEIRQVETEIGSMVSITLEPDTDAGELLFTLMVPRVTLAAGGGEQPIKTVGLLTRSRLFPRLPVSVQLQTYETVDLKGNAAFVVS